LQIYTNGVPDTSLVTAERWLANANPLMIGGFGSDGTPFSGRIDEVGIFNRALNASEIAAICIDIEDPAGNVSDPLTATVLLKPVRREPENYYVSLQTAYGEAGSGETLRVLAVTLTENIDLNQLRDISISGGYEDGFAGQIGYSTILGTLTMGRGSLTVERVIVK
jgi:hypothetical protein